MKPRKPIKRSPVKRKPRKPRPGEDPEYLDFIRTLPCVICWGYPGVHTPLGTCQPYWDYEFKHGQPSQLSKTEACHFGPRAYGTKSPDKTALPFCGIEHHREGPYSHHRLGKRFAAHHGLDVEKLIAELNRRYDEENVERL